jgi:hypothetical protein
MAGADNHEFWSAVATALEYRSPTVAPASECTFDFVESDKKQEESMSTSLTMMGIESLTLEVNQEIRVRASLENTFAALLEQVGPENESPQGKMPMKLEAWPGGRWFRDLGDGNGHLWGHVQAIKRPTLLEICGPLFFSYAVVSNLQYRLSEQNGETVIKFHHKAFGVISEEHRRGVTTGWNHINQLIKARAERGR